MIKFILILLSFVFTPFLFAQEKEVWSLEKPRSLGWSEVMYKCIDFQKQNKKNYFITLYYGTNSKGEHKYVRMYTPLTDIENTDLDVKLTTQKIIIFDAKHTHIVGGIGNGYIEGNEQPFLPEDISTGSTIEKKNLRIKGGKTELYGDYLVKVTATDKTKTEIESEYPHNKIGNWIIKSSIKIPTEKTPFIIILREDFLATNSNLTNGNCVQEYFYVYMDPKKTPIPKIITQ